MSMIKGETIWITGASSGIGAALAERLAHDNRVLVSARNHDALQALEQRCGAEPLPLDVTDDEALPGAGKTLTKLCGHLDRVILNAGTCEYFDLARPDWDMMRRVMDVNYFGALNCLEIALPLLRRHAIARGHLVAVGSQASRAGFPRAQAYGASKAALTYFMAAMAIDLASSDIDVTVIQPGFVDTPLTRRNDFAMPFLMDTDAAVREILRGLQRRPLLHSFPRRLNAVLALAEQAPQFWCRRVAARMSRSDNA